MKKCYSISFLCSLLVLFIGVNIAEAQTTVVINTGTAGTAAYNAGPIYRSSATSAYNASRYTYLYTQSELAAAGIVNGSIITELGWAKNNSTVANGPAIFNIYMKNSSATAFSNASETWANLNSGATLVYGNNAFTVPATTQPTYITFTLATPFTYTGGAIEISTEFDINGISGNPSTGTFDWLWSTVPDRIYGTGNTTLAPITSLSSTTNSISTIDDRRPFLQITFTSTPCTNPPTPGTATSSLSNVCSGNQFSLSMTGGSVGIGLSYQWQSSTNNTSFSDISGATTTVYNNVSQSVTSYYRCKIICSGGTPVYSNTVTVTSPPLFPAGTYTINPSSPTAGTNFNNFTDAFNAINCGVAGAVTFNVSAGQVFNETPPVLNVSGTSTGAITFQKFGPGSNPVIMASTPGTIASSTTLGSDGDGIITINGGDYITFDGIDLTSNFSTGVDIFEYGYYLKKASGTNACKNVTIKNSTITLNKAAIYSFGIFVSNNSGTTAGITVTSTGGRSENIKLSGNIIQGSYGGIMVRGFADATPYDFYDQNIEIGVDAPNSIVEFGGGASTAYGIYTIYQNNLKVANNTVTSAPAGQTTTMYGIYATTSVNGNGSIYGNSVTIHGKGTTTSIYAIYTDMGGTGTSNTVNVYNNTVSNCTYTSATSGSMYLIYIGGTVYKVNAYANRLTNNTHSPTTTGSMYGLYQTGATINEIRMYDNFIDGNNKSTGTTGTVYWLYNNSSATVTSYIYKDTVTNNMATGTTGSMYGIYIASGLANNIYRNKINDLTHTSTTGGIFGITLASGITNNVYNNFIGSLNAPTVSSTTDGVRGINITSTTATSTANISFNTIYLNTTSSGTDFSSSGIFHTTSATATTANLVMKNNIIFNQSTPNGAGIASAYRRSSATLSNFDASSNNNLFYAGAPSTNQLVFYDGTNSDQTLASYKTRVTPRESASISEIPNFIGAPTDLHVSSTIPTQIESGGITVTGITDDFDGNARNATTPDIGADEFTGISADLTGPTISYTALPVKSICIEGKTITAAITDPSNINVTAGLKPRLWFKKETNADALPANNNSTGNGWKWVEASNSTSPFTFNFDFNLLTSPLAQGDSVSYFVTAQDLASTPNVGANLVTFNNVPTTVALSTNAFPVTGAINGFRILNIPNPIAIKADKTELCASGTVTLNVDGVDITGASYQWQSTHYGTNNWADIPSATTVPYTTGTITDSSSFRLVVKCGGTPISSSPSNVISVAVNNPQLLTTTPATRCGVGTVNLSATASPGMSINWYAAATGGTPLLTGNSNFTTPSISSTTTYYAAAATGGGTASVGLPAVITTNSSGSGTTNFGLVFDVLSPFTLYSVVVYPVSASSAAGTVTIDMINSSGTVVNTATVNVVGSPSGTPSPQTVVLNFNMPVGTNYKLRPGSMTGISGLLFEPSAGAPGGNYGYPFTIPGVVSINTSTLTAAPTNTARNDLYYYFYNWQVSAGCEGTRVPVIATISTPPTLVLSGHKTICNNAIDSVMVTSTASNYNSYVWSPSTGLFTDAACTIPYNGAASALKLYVKNATPGKTGYKCTATNTTTQCVNELADTVIVMPVPTISAAPTDICVSGTTVLSLAPSTGYTNGALQWQTSPNGTTYSDIPSASGVTYTTPTLTSTTYYKLVLKGSNGIVCAGSPTQTVVVNSPSVTSTVPGTRCGTGTVNLSATPSTGATISWYTASTGGSPLASGNTFTTPSISTTTTYYAGANSGGSTAYVGKYGLESDASGTGGGLTSYINFDAISDFILKTVDIFPYAATAGTSGTITIELRTSTGTSLMTKTVNVTGAANTVAATTRNTVTLDFPITGGASYRLGVTAWTGATNIFRDGTGVSYPYTLPGVVSITSSNLSPYYYFFYNWQVSTGCESSRTAVTATVDCGVPITLLNFKGERQGSMNRLQWSTSTELNNAGFELERSADGTNFSSLSFIATKAVNGSSNTALNYSFDDVKPLLGNAYYRLKQVDRDGRSSYSNVVLIKGNRVGALTIGSIYPNPVTDRLNVVLTAPGTDRVTLVVTDLAGKVVTIQNLPVVPGDNNYQLNVSNLSSGSYFIKAVCGNGCETAVQKFVK